MKRGISGGESDILYPSLDVASFPDSARASDDEDRIINEVSLRHPFEIERLFKWWEFQNDLAVGRAIAIPQSGVCLQSSAYFQGESPLPLLENILLFNLQKSSDIQNL